jgi:hypothetical protein
MTHLTEEQLILHYYSEADDSASTDRHLDQCPECRALYASVERVLNVMDALPVPERGARYETQVWDRVAPYLPVRRRLPFLASPWGWAAATTALAGVVIAAFLAGRSFPRPSGSSVPIAAVKPQTEERVLKLAVGDYLERSQNVLLELANADSPEGLDISAEQERIANLLGENRLYRQTALRTGDGLMAGVLDELERVLLEIAHAPSRLTPEQLQELRRRLRTDDILFRIRVLGSSVRSQDQHEL